MGLLRLIANRRDNPVYRRRAPGRRGLVYQWLLIGIAIVTCASSVYAALSTGFLHTMLTGGMANDTYLSTDAVSEYVSLHILNGGILVPAIWLLLALRGPIRSEQEEFALTPLSPAEIAFGWLAFPVAFCAFLHLLLLLPLILFAITERGSAAWISTMYIYAICQAYSMLTLRNSVRHWLHRPGQRWIVLVVAGVQSGIQLFLETIQEVLDVVRRAPAGWRPLDHRTGQKAPFFHAQALPQ